MDYFVIEQDLSGVQKALEGTSKSIEAIEKGTLRVIAKGTVKAIKQSIRMQFHKGTGELLKAYTYKIKDGVATVFPRGRRGVIFAKVMALNYGSETQKRKPHNFIQAGERFLESGAYMNDLENFVDAILKKYWS